MQGIDLVLILLNLMVFLETIFYWVDEIELDNHRNKKAENAMDLATWELL